MRLVLALALLGCGSSSPSVDASGGDAIARVPGFTAEYFDQYRVLARTAVEPEIDHVFETDRFSARYTGVLEIPTAGPYTFAIDADDGTRLWVNGALVIDDWRGHFVEHREVTVDLPAGDVDIRLDYFELDLDARLKLSWTPQTPVMTAPPIAGAPKPPYANPVVATDCPDPGVLATGTPPTYYAICTGGRFRIRRSYDLVMWEDTDAFVFPSGKPPYAANGNRNWAPELHEVGGKFLVYYTSVNADNVLSIGVATANSPTGPYVDRGTPLVEHPQGVIDATYVAAGGKHYLAYKIDGNSVGQPTPMYLRELAPNGLSFAAGSAQIELLRNAAGTWEGGVVEAPWIVEHGGMFYLFYSGNVYDARYRTGVARASSVTGPYTKFAGNPILKNDATWVGPGHGSVVAVGAKHYFVYHAWRNNGGGGNDTEKGRQILVDEIVWQDGWPRISDGTPSEGARPWPGETN
ncbi:MAG: family 43 glycosylhydrolase [Myxococcota bacterium]|nr:family 43 glycosylhydrolase [Deltaproteobacteria bacterium]MDQ3335459.1 family 43 glycosylhydrolase [Myxococcota bacterium]